MRKQLIAAAAAASLAFMTLASGLDVGASSIIDEDYRFRLDSPGPAWNLLDRDQVRPMAPDAVAGAVHAEGLFGLVIVEHAPDADVEVFARLILESMPLGEKRIESFETTEFEHRPAAQFFVSGNIDGIDFRYQNVVFANGEFLYQVLVGGLLSETAADGSSFTPFLDSFHLLDGEVVGRSETYTLADTVGVGWRLRSGVFESAAYGLSVTPPTDWRVAVGADLSNMSSDAEVGLVRYNPDVNVVLICERAEGVERERFAANLIEGMQSSLLPVQRERMVTLDGRPLTLRAYSTAGEPEFRILHGVLFHGTTCVQVQAWFLPAGEEQALLALPEALASVKFLSPRESRDLTAELAAAPDSQNLVGSGFSLRQGVYRDFEGGFTWTKPAGSWRVTAGSAARAQGPNTVLLLEEPVLGLFAELELESSEGMDGEAFFRFVMDDEFGEMPQEWTQEGSACSGGTDVHVVGYDLRYEIRTTVAGERALRFLIWGTPANLAAAQDEVQAAFRALELSDAALPSHVLSKDSYRDLRLGFELRKPSFGWTFRDSTSASVSAIGSGPMWTGMRGEMIRVISVCATDPGQDLTWFADLMSTSFQQEVAQDFGTEPTESQTTVAGLPAQHMTWKRGRDQLDALMFVRDRTFFGLIVLSKKGWPSIDQAQATFRLLD